mgnify:CR=1 FL=1
MADDVRRADTSSGDPGSGAPRRPPQPLRDSAPRRTYLAAERTYLAWLRTGLGTLGLSLAVGRLIPALIDASHVRFGLLGAGYGLLGMAMIVFAAVRQRRILRALVEDQPVPTDAWATTWLSATSLVLALATVALVVAEI